MFLTVNRQAPWFSEVFEDANYSFKKFFDDEFPVSVNTDSIKINTKETDLSYIIEALLPGVNKKDISIELINDNIKISYNHEENKSDKNEKFITNEFSLKTKERTIRLNNDIDIDKITTDYTDGLLTIVIPKKSNTRKKINL